MTTYYVLLSCGHWFPDRCPPGAPSMYSSGMYAGCPEGDGTNLVVAVFP